MGATVEERPDGLKVAGRSAGKLHGAEIEPHGDHRIAMAFAVAALGAQKARPRFAMRSALAFPIRRFTKIWLASRNRLSAAISDW